jgi:hypothetical protein
MLLKTTLLLLSCISATAAVGLAGAVRFEVNEAPSGCNSTAADKF